MTIKSNTSRKRLKMIFIFIEYLSETIDLCKEGNKLERQIN
jgi:hypothetical protein